MKLFKLFCIIFFTVLSVNAQIDTRKKSGSIIPAVESPKDSIDNRLKLPAKPEANTPIDRGVVMPKVSQKLELPKKEFSMFPEEEFKNPGELYVKKLDKKAEELRPEGHGLNAGLKEDAYWGDYKTTTKYIQILYRDFSAIDGDLLRVLVNDDIIQSNILLTGGFKGFKLDLEEGNNKIDFYAMTTGSSGPNTAEYKILDDKGNVITGRVWALAKDVKVTVIVVKE